MAQSPETSEEIIARLQRELAEKERQLPVETAERRRLESALEQSRDEVEARMAVAVDSLPGIFYLFNSEGRFLRWNAKFERISGYDAAEITAMRPLNFFDDTDQPLIAARIEEAFTLGESTAEAELLAKDGRKTPYFFSGRRILFNDVPCVIGMGVDIAERKKVEEALRQSETQLQHIINAAPEGMLLLDSAERIILANPAGKGYLYLLAPDWTEGTLTRLGDYSLAELLASPPKGLWHEINSDGRYFEAVARPVESGPSNMGWVMVLRDVTQKREIQQRVEEQERLAAVGQLAAGIAHDFNNIIAIILLYAQIMQNPRFALPPSALEKAQTIEQQAKRATDLIQQIMDFSRQSFLTRQPLDLTPFLQSFSSLLKRALPENVTIELHYNPAEHLIYADSSRMQQVFMNLAMNARDAMPSGGRLQFGLARLALKAGATPPMPEMQPGDWVVIRVADSGVGISPQALRRIFEPFFTTKEVGKGIGLGLAQVYGIMRQHDGYLEVATELGQGTTFFLYFPALTAAENVDLIEAGNGDLPLGDGRLVLIVEDNAATRRALADGLRQLNYQTVEADNGREAIAILESHPDPIDLILSDVVMPEMGGVALFHAMRQRGWQTPLLLLTGHPMAAEMESLTGQGLAGWAQKPVSLSSLAQLLARVWA